MAGAHDLQMLIDSVESAAGEMLMVPDPVARRALSVVASYARDADDFRLLLEVLGLMPEDGQAAQQPAMGRTEDVPSGAPGPAAGADGPPQSSAVPPSLADGTAAVPGRRRLRP